jgi:hypothetical protein
VRHSECHGWRLQVGIAGRQVVDRLVIFIII